MRDRVDLEGAVSFANNLPFVLIGGMNVIEGEDIALEVAATFVRVTLPVFFAEKL